MRNPRIIEPYLEPADKALKEQGILNSEGRVKFAEYEGYIAGFGPAVVNMGIKPALAFYCANPPANPDRSPSRKKVIEAIVRVIDIPNVESGDELLSAMVNQEPRSPLLEEYKEKIVNASLAMKMMLRTHPFPEQSEKQNQS